MAKKKKTGGRGRKTCPHCKKPIGVRSKTCKLCGKAIPSKTPAAKAKSTTPTKKGLLPQLTAERDRLKKQLNAVETLIAAYK